MHCGRGYENCFLAIRQARRSRHHLSSRWQSWLCTGWLDTTQRTPRTDSFHVVDMAVQPTAGGPFAQQTVDLPISTLWFSFVQVFRAFNLTNASPLVQVACECHLCKSTQAISVEVCIFDGRCFSHLPPEKRWKENWNEVGQLLSRLVKLPMILMVDVHLSNFLWTTPLNDSELHLSLFCEFHLQLAQLIHVIKCKLTCASWPAKHQVQVSNCKPTCFFPEAATSRAAWPGIRPVSWFLNLQEKLWEICYGFVHRLEAD